ncbi:chemotaxis protein CheW [Tautonia sociabilis]|uniref:Chemotaxis protein CheW n=1 Tax=Tautonia sociabilis TaxID=2080755 RepID=A0A432MCL3_9BACT|nr:chemotaxis protein CheW [Tautonia sociabilis]RUL82003.1 chemotaxis protein CheW [Tautonia sociabilis]
MDEPIGGGPPRAYCLFSCESRPMGVPLEAVAEVMEPGRLVRLPLCPKPVRGLCTCRGKIVPVIGASRPAGEPIPPPGDRSGALLMLRSANGPWGLAIDRAGVTVEVAPESPAAGELAPPGGFVVSGTVQRGGIPHAILDIDRTWKGLKAEIDRWYAAVLGVESPGNPSPRPARAG